MAVFEKKKALKVSIDDTVSLSCTLEAAQKTADHMVYFIQIHMHFHCIYHACWIDMPLERICIQALDIHIPIFIPLSQHVEISRPLQKSANCKQISLFHPELLSL